MIFNFFKINNFIQVTTIANAIHSTYVAKCLNYVVKSYTYVPKGEFSPFAGKNVLAF